MLRSALIFLIVALIAGALGFFGVAGTAGTIAKWLFVIFLILFVVSLITGRGRTAVPSASPDPPCPRFHRTRDRVTGWVSSARSRSTGMAASST